MDLTPETAPAPTSIGSLDGLMPPSKPVSEMQSEIITRVKDVKDNNENVMLLDNMSDCEEMGEVESSGPLICGICQSTPKKTPLYGCEKGHYICQSCRVMGGALLSCAKCFSPNICHRLIPQEGQLFTKECAFAVKGCRERLSEDIREEHEEDCPYRIVHCPKKLFSKTCVHVDSFINIRDHGRKVHDYNAGFTKLDDGCITSKMMTSKKQDNNNFVSHSARFAPLELEYDQSLFYIYYERKHSRSLWFFFIRLYGSERKLSKYRCEIHVGPASLEKNDICEAQRVYRGKAVPYGTGREEIHASGRCLTIDDDSIRMFRQDNVLFRIWWRITKADSPPMF